MSNNPIKKTAFSGNPTKSRHGGKQVSVASTTHKRSVYGASRILLSSSSRKNAHLPASSDINAVSAGQPKIVDDQGRDVTPLALLTLDAAVVRKNQSNILVDIVVGTPTELLSQASIYQTGTLTASTFGGPFTSQNRTQRCYSVRSVFSASISGRSTGSTDDSLGETETLQTWDAKVTYKREEVAEQLTEHDLENTVTLQLSETDTLWLLDMPGVCVSLENEEATAVREQNARYQELVKSRVGNDLYVERGMNTFNNPPKYKYVQTTKIGYADAGVNATTWDMYDTHKLVEDQAVKAKADEDASKESVLSRPSTSKIDVEVGTDGSPASPAKTIESMTTIVSSTADDSVFNSKDSGLTGVAEDNKNTIFEHESFRRDLQVMERVINLNNYQPRQAAYRGFELIEDMDKLVKVVTEEPEKVIKAVSSQPSAVVSNIPQDFGPNLYRLWEYKCPLTKGHNVSCIAWNKENPDLLAVGYGQYDFTKQKSGLICCWSLKNTEYPERVYTTEVGVTALDFSQLHTNLLTVGLYNGTVSIYNVRSTQNDPVLDSLRDLRSGKDEVESTGKHTGPVWELKWIEKERGSGEEKSEVLVSISTDGRITQWSIRKGFDSYDLMKLKRTAIKTVTGKTKKTEALISKFAGGLCFEFHNNDKNIYLAGTEEGHIHRCSCSYNEQYLDSYYGHTGPVYGLQWSPFAPEVFLSCSGDWSIRLWHEDRLKPVLNFFSSTKSIPSVCWSPRCSTVFACVNEGAVEVWDLKQSTLDPIITNVPALGVKLSTVTFAKNSECILVGDSEGQVTVYQLRCMPAPPKPDEQYEALHKIIKASLASELEPQK